MKLINVVVFDAEYEGPLPVAFPIEQIKDLSAGYQDKLHIYVGNKRVSDYTVDDGYGSFFIEAITQQNYFTQRLHMINHLESLNEKNHDAIHLLNILYNPQAFSHEIEEYQDIFFSKEEVAHFKQLISDDIGLVNTDKLTSILEKISLESSLEKLSNKSIKNKI